MRPMIEENCCDFPLGSVQPCWRIVVHCIFVGLKVEFCDIICILMGKRGSTWDLTPRINLHVTSRKRMEIR